MSVIEFVSQPAQSNRLGDYLNENFTKTWTHFRAAVAFVKRSGVRHIEANLAEFSLNNDAEILVGIDHRGTSHEGLRSLLEAVVPRGKVSIFHNPGSRTFHPKIFMFKSSSAADVIIGSGNLTEGGLFTNYEAGLRLQLDLAYPEHAQILQDIESVYENWSDTSLGTAVTLDLPLLNRLTALGLVPPETMISAAIGQDSQYITEGPDNHPFTARGAPGAPRIRVPTVNVPAVPNSPPPVLWPRSLSGFVMTLQQTDVGVGQTTSGTSRRSPEIFIPLSARDVNPDFWGWTNEFIEDPRRPGKYDRLGVRMRLGGADIVVNMMTWPVKHDFRLRSESLRSSGNIGDILRIEKATPSAPYEYYVEVVPQGTTQFPVFLRLCTQTVRNSQKLYGYY